jgi:class 3 adenylate cyclase
VVRRRQDQRGLTTLLFTDIAGSSEVAAELRDRRWRVLLARHHEIVRKAPKRYRGREVDNAVDRFFAAFDDQADAIRCACVISDALEGLVAGSGLRFADAGEVELKGFRDRWRVERLVG